jgi:hypothetical protein
MKNAVATLNLSEERDHVAWPGRPLKRFIITALAAALLHAVACILIPPFEFAPTRPACFFYALVGGLIAFPIILAVLLLPLRAGLRRLVPRATEHTRALLAGLALGAVVVLMILPRQLAGVPVKPYQQSYIHVWTFWLLLALVVNVSFFWPLPERAAAVKTAR